MWLLLTPTFTLTFTLATASPLDDQITALERELAEERRRSTREIVAAVIEDAEQRSWGAGWRDGFGFHGHDGEFTLTVSGQMQMSPGAGRPGAMIGAGLAGADGA